MDLKEEIRAIVRAAMTEKRAFDDDENLIDSGGLDSMGIIDVEMGIEKHFKVPPIPATADRLLSVNWLEEYVMQHLA